MKMVMLQWCSKMINKDLRVSFMREHNYGVKLGGSSRWMSRFIFIISFIL